MPLQKKQDNLLKETFQNGTKLDYLKALPNDTYKKHFCWEKPAIGSTDENDENKVDVPETVEQMGTKGMGHFYRSKIKSMLMENDKLRIELKNKVNIKIVCTPTPINTSPVISVKK